MIDNELNFLIEQIEADLDAGYITERAKWRKVLDNGDTSWDGDPTVYYHHANGEIGSFSKKDADPNNTNDEALYSQNTDYDTQKTRYYKGAVAKGLSNYMRYYDYYKEFSPEKIAMSVASQVQRYETGIIMSSRFGIKPEAAFQLCRLYIQSALASAQGDKKKKLLMLLKAIKNPEFLNTLKKWLGRSVSNPESWLRRTDKPNTKGRLADV